jgi:hypothetical protein
MLHSDWLLHMLDKAGTSPRARVLALFDILQDWSAAPGVDRKTGLTTPSPALLAYLSQQLSALGASEPDMLAQQIYCLALGALQVSHGDDGMHAFVQGKQAAAVLLQAHLPRRGLTAGIGMAAAASMLLAATALFLLQGHASRDNVSVMPVQAAAPALRPLLVASASPDQIASLHDSLERFRRGVCQYPQALMLAPEDRSVFLENVVNGTVPADSSQLHEARQLAQKVECYYAPVAMTAM